MNSSAIAQQRHSVEVFPTIANRSIRCLEITQQRLVEHVNVSASSFVSKSLSVDTIRRSVVSVSTQEIHS